MFLRNYYFCIEQFHKQPGRWLIVKVEEVTMQANENVTTQDRFGAFAKNLPMLLLNSALVSLVGWAVMPISNVFRAVLLLGLLAAYFIYLILILRDLGIFGSRQDLRSKRATPGSDRSFTTADHA